MTIDSLASRHVHTPSVAKLEAVQAFGAVGIHPTEAAAAACNLASPLRAHRNRGGGQAVRARAIERRVRQIHAASRKFRQDNTLSGYIERRLKDVEALCDLALSRMDQTGQKVPSALAEFQSGKNGVCSDAWRDRVCPGRSRS